MSHTPRPVVRRWAPVAAALAGAAVVTAPSTAPAAVAPGKTIVITANTSDVLLSAYANGAAVSVLRDGVKIASGVNANIPGVAPAEGGINSAHLAGAGGCWTAFTPQLLPGDTIRVGAADSVVVAGVTAEPLVLTGDQMIVRGVAETAAGTRLPAAEIDAQLWAPGGRFSAGSSGGQFLSAQRGDLGGIITYDGPASSHWTARWPIPAGAGDRAFAAASSVFGAWTGPAGLPPGAGGQESKFEAAALPGPTAACDATAPYAPDAVTGADRPVVNAANQGSGLVLHGAAQPGVTAVTATLTDAAGRTLSQAASVTGRTWSATFPAADVTALADGALRAAARFTIAAGSFHGATWSLAKDTAAPAAPTASVAAGSYPSAQRVALAAEPGATVRYTTDGSDPTAASPAARESVEVEHSETLKAVAVDAAGNASPVAAFGYVIAPAQAPAAINRAAGMRVEALRVSRTLGLRVARRHGISVLLTAPRGAKVVRVRLLLGRRVVTTVLRHVKGNRLMTVVLPRSRKGRRHLHPGVYRVQVTPGLDQATLGVTASRTVRIR